MDEAGVRMAMAVVGSGFAVGKVRAADMGCDLSVVGEIRYVRWRS